LPVTFYLLKPSPPKEQAVLQKPLVIFGDGKSTRDFVFVKDIAVAIVDTMLRANQPPFAVYNVGTATETSIRRLAESVIKAVHSRSEIKLSEARKGDINKSMANITLISRQFDWFPKCKESFSFSSIPIRMKDFF